MGIRSISSLQQDTIYKKNHEKVAQTSLNNQFVDNTIKRPQADSIQLFNFNRPQYHPQKDILEYPNYKYPKIPAVSADDVAKQTGLSKELVNTVIKMEGFKTKAYKDLKGIKTIGVGHNIEADKDYHLGNTISKQEAYTLLKDDLLKAKDTLSKMVDINKLSQGQKEALTDVIFNVGKQQLKDSKLIQYINNGEYDKALQEFNFVCVKNQVNTHLCKRRITDLKFFGGDRNNLIKARNTILNRGLSDLNKKIRNANSILKKKQLENMKEKFIKDTTAIINRYM